MNVADEIKRLAELKGLHTQQQIADATGLSRSFVARLLSGERPNLTAEVLFRLCDGLGVGCDHFRPFVVGEEEEVEKQDSKKDTRKKGKK